jgi:hypothetical protein
MSTIANAKDPVKRTVIAAQLLFKNSVRCLRDKAKARLALMDHATNASRLIRR